MTNSVGRIPCPKLFDLNVLFFCFVFLYRTPYVRVRDKGLADTGRGVWVLSPLRPITEQSIKSSDIPARRLIFSCINGHLNSGSTYHMSDRPPATTWTRSFFLSSIKEHLKTLPTIQSIRKDDPRTP